MPASAFSQSVYALCRRIPRGFVSTYGQLAQALGKPGASRAVGQALKANPFAPLVPCHRVIRADGSLGGFNAGLSRKLKLLKQEGIKIKAGHISLERYQHEFKNKK